MPRKAAVIEVTLEERAQLKRLIHGRVVSKHLAQRAQIILDCQAGKENREIAKERGLCEQTVAQWRNRFLGKRLLGLEDAPRSRAPKKYGKH